MTIDKERIEKDLIDSMRHYDELRTKLVYNPIESEQKHFMEENDLHEKWQIEECIEQREESEVCKAADELDVSVIDLNIWICETK